MTFDHAFRRLIHRLQSYLSPEEEENMKYLTRDFGLHSRRQG